MNLSLSPQHIEATLKLLADAYFQKGGMQLQVMCVSRDDMLDALDNPEKHKNLIVRIGGFRIFQ